MSGPDLVGSEYNDRSNFYQYKSLSWTEYADLRPRYPDELLNLVTDYMSKHNRTQRISSIDYGSGTGKAIGPILGKFGIQRVLANDLNERQLKDCETFLQQNFEPERFEVVLGAAGELHSVPDQSIDLVVAAEAAHWFHQAKWFAEVARVLRTSGTLAIWHYPLQVAILSHPDAVPACNRMWERFFEVSVPRDAVSLEQMLFSTSLMDSVVVDPDKFHRQTRYKWLYPRSISDRISRIADLGMLDAPFTEQQAQAGLLATPQVKVQSVVPTASEETLLRAEGWTMETLWRYFNTGSINIDNLLQDHIFQESMEEVERLVGGPEATFSVGWQLSLLLATRC